MAGFYENISNVTTTESDELDALAYKNAAAQSAADAAFAVLTATNVNLTGAGSTTISGTHPDITITTPTGTNLNTSNELVKRHSDGSFSAGVISWTSGNSTNANTAYGWGDHSVEGYITSTLTADLSLGNNIKINLGNSDDLQLYHDGSNSIIKDAGSGVLRYTSNSSSAAGVVFEIENTDTDAASGSFIHFKDSMGLDPCKIGAVGSSFFVMSPTNEYMIKANSNSDVELYYNNLKKLETTSLGINVVGEVKGDSLDIDGDADISGGLTAGNFTFTGDEIISSGSTMTLDPHADGITGKVVVNGNLEVKGTTTTIDSTTIDLGDTLINLNSNQDELSDPPDSLTAGITVDRGNASYDSHLLWRESSNTWRVSTGGNYDYELLHVGNFESAVTSLDGGSF